MKLVMRMPAIVTLIVSLPFDQVFEAIVPHSTVQDLLNLVFFFAINERWRCRRGRLVAWDGVWKSDGEFDNKKDRMKLSKLRR
jgi:hypothetical protein